MDQSIFLHLVILVKIIIKKNPLLNRHHFKQVYSRRMNVIDMDQRPSMDQTSNKMHSPK